MGVRKEVAKEYYAWVDMRRRCSNPEHQQYKNYGARGIKVCPEWGSFVTFYADMGKAPSREHSLDRVDNDGDYEPSNCRWATAYDQSNNQRSNRVLHHAGKALTVAQWAKELGVSRSVISCRLRAGKSVPEALNPHVVPKKRKILHNGEYKSEAEWSRILGIPGTTIRARVRQGRPIDKYVKPRKEQ
jgi:hypothetical protein